MAAKQILSSAKKKPKSRQGVHVKLSRIGEFGLIERIRKNIRKADGPVKVGPGDDTAVFALSPGNDLLATCDAQVEGVHFSRDHATGFEIGRKAVAVNISDIAAMGGDPLYILASVGAPENTSVAFMDELTKGMDHEAGLWGAFIIGGNLAGNPERLFVDIFVLGRVKEGRAMLRNGAANGDAIAVTGFLGDSAAGFHILNHPETKVPDNIRGNLVQAHILPAPRVCEGRVLMDSGKTSAAMDISDGLLSDLSHLLKASEKGAVLKSNKLPVSDNCRKAAKILGQDPIAWALAGGEDYQLLFTAQSDAVPVLEKAMRENCGTGIHVIGHINEDTQNLVVLDENNEPMSMDANSGWDHF